MATVTQEVNNPCQAYTLSQDPGSYTHPGLSGSTLSGVAQLWISNNPEEIGTSDLADAGVWILKESVNGSYNMFLWHGNSAGETINAALQLYNHGPNSVTVTVHQAGVKSGGAAVTDGHGNSVTGRTDNVGMWADYYNGNNSTSYAVASGGYQDLFVWTSIPVTSGPNGIWGLIAYVTVSVPSGNSAPSLTDFAWYTNSGGAKAAAASQCDSLCVSCPPSTPCYCANQAGHGTSCQSSVEVTDPSTGGALDLNARHNTFMGFYICGGHQSNCNCTNSAATDSAGDTDVLSVTALDAHSYQVLGNYGCITNISIQLTNSGSGSHTLNLYAGAWAYTSGIGVTGPSGFGGMMNLPKGYAAYLFAVTLSAGESYTFDFPILTMGYMTYPIGIVLGFGAQLSVSSPQPSGITCS